MVDSPRWCSPLIQGPPPRFLSRHKPDTKKWTASVQYQSVSEGLRHLFRGGWVSLGVRSPWSPRQGSCRWTRSLLRARGRGGGRGDTGLGSRSAGMFRRPHRTPGLLRHAQPASGVSACRHHRRPPGTAGTTSVRQGRVGSLTSPFHFCIRGYARSL